jgi:hypothetical protein
MKKFLILLGFCLLCVPLFAGETGSAQNSLKAAAKPLKADILLVATPIRAKSIMAGGTVNALEKPAGEMPPVWTAVVFRVERIVDGDFKIPQKEEISLWSQMKDSAEEKNILKLLIMDFERPDENGTDKEWLSMAVIDPYASFGIREGEEPAHRQRYKLSLARVHRDPDSYVLVKSEKI